MNDESQHDHDRVTAQDTQAALDMLHLIRLAIGGSEKNGSNPDFLNRVETYRADFIRQYDLLAKQENGVTSGD